MGEVTSKWSTELSYYIEARRKGQEETYLVYSDCNEKLNKAQEEIEEVNALFVKMSRNYQEEIQKRDKLLSSILGIMKGRIHQNYDGEITITESEYDQWLKDTKALEGE